MVSRRYLKIALCCAVLLAGAGCAVTPNALYPDFAKRVARNTQDLCVAVDVAVQEDIGGEMDGIDAQANRKFGELIGNELQTVLREKGYRADKLFVFSGLWGDRRELRELRPGVDRSTDGIKLPMAHAPYYVDGKVDKRSRPAFAALLTKLSETRGKSQGDASPVLKEAIAVARDLSGDAIVSVLLVARNVQIGKSTGQALVTGLLTLGTLAVWEVSVVSVELDVLDANTGEIIWANRGYEKGGEVDGDRLKRMVRGLVNELPARVGSASS